MQKVSFECENCETKGSVRLPDDFDECKVEFCPVCGDPLPVDYDDNDDGY